MAISVIMPKFGMTQEEATILRWYKEVGEWIEKGEPLLEVQTDKVSMDVESPADGVLLEVKYGSDEVVPVTTVIAYIGEPDEVVVEEEVAISNPNVAAAAASSVSERQVVAAPSGKVRATPVVRKLAQDKGVDINLVKGTGPNGLIRAEDVENYLASQSVGLPVPELTKDRALPLTGVRRTIAKRMQSSWQTAPHITFTVTIDMTEAEARRAAWNEGRSAGQDKLSLTGLLIGVVARLLTKHSYLNASAGDGEIILHNEVNIGMAVAMEEGLIVPVIKGADALSLEQIAVKTRELARAAREGNLVLDEVTGGTFTISNLGMFGVEQFTAVINPPESAILAVGRVKPEMVVVDGRVAIGHMMRVTLSIDHRVADGAMAGMFLSDLRGMLEQPDGVFN